MSMQGALVYGCGAPVCRPVKSVARIADPPSLKRGRPFGAVCGSRAAANKRLRREDGVARPLCFKASAARKNRTDEEVINEQIDKAATVLNSMMEEIHQDTFVSGAVAEITGQAPDVTEEEAIKKAVGSRMDWLDEAFLVALGAYVKAADEQGDAALAGRLSRIQQRVLQEVSERLPPEMRILDMVLRLLMRSERMNTLRLAATGQGGEAVPSCEIRRVQGAALQLVSDMEEKDAIPDRKLLARLCIAREEIAEVAAEQKSKGEYSGSTEEMYETKMTFHNQGMPQASLAFLKELLTMSDKTKRVAFLQKAFREEFEPRKKASKVSSQNAAADAIRPGSFLSCIKASKEQMQNMKGVEPTLSKLEVIRLEALRVLESMAA